ncbi:MAG: tRNA 4-thiouridine(8) synthase ThiI [Candidatus Aenigmarchaeota archaeon]|nr:tRNA 4-thiouridine(8) synthase ThiI [Candidatus Aenigmarchaeota archaeon]
MECIVVHYSEIGLKGRNRGFFENMLISNIRQSLKEFAPIVERLSGRIMIDYDPDDRKEIEKRLQRISGISSFSFALAAERDIEDIKSAIDRLATGKVKSFAISTFRGDKTFRHKSQEMNVMLGDYVNEKYGWKVNLTNPDRTFFVEISRKHVFIFTEKIRGPGGLPVGSSGKLVSLISGGIDSPVAAYEMFKRGCPIVFVHFHNWGTDKEVVRDKVESLVKVLSKHQPRTVLYMVPFEELQKSIIAHVPSKYRIIVYRRVMFGIAGMIARKEKALGFVTGDSVGQVASQTLENIYCIYAMAQLPVFTPIAGSNKEDIVAKAKEIGTYDISILPYSDCCSFLVDKHPETRAKLEVIEKVESPIDIEALSRNALEHTEILKF